jgi:hypothetical protein
MNKKTIVTLADSNYFELLMELIASIKKFPQSKDISICVLDAGLTEEQVKEIEKEVYCVKKAKWDIDVPKYKTLGKEWLKSQVSRAFLPNYFPEFEKYLWIDCDAWVNSWNTIELYFRACEKNRLGITQTMGPGYRVMSKVNWLFGKYAAIKSQNYKHAKLSGLSEKIARKIAFAPHLNIGVFSLEKTSPCWALWQRNLKTTLAGGKIFGSEGLAINISVYLDNAPTEFLPLYCNWIPSNLLPKYDKQKTTFVEPNLPNYEIGIMHLAAGIWSEGNDMRVNKDLKIEIVTLDDEVVLKSLRFNK